MTLNLTEPSATILSTLDAPEHSHRKPGGARRSSRPTQAHRTRTASSSPSGTYSTEHPTGTGPYKFESWDRGEQLVLVRNDDYWGEPALTEKLIFRPIADNAARLQALQTGEIQGYDLVEPQDVATIEGDANLQLLDRPPFNVGYVTINHAKPPMDELEVRQAVAHALNREEVVDSFYAGRGVVATQFMPQRDRRLRGRRQALRVRPGEGETAPAAGGPDAAGRDRVLVPDGRQSRLHAGPEAELRGVRGRPERRGLQGDAAKRSLAARTTSVASTTATPAT